MKTLLAPIHKIKSINAKALQQDLQSNEGMIRVGLVLVPAISLLIFSSNFLLTLLFIILFSIGLMSLTIDIDNLAIEPALEADPDDNTSDTDKTESSKEAKDDSKTSKSLDKSENTADTKKKELESEKD